MAREAKRIGFLFVAALGCGFVISAVADDELKSAPSWQVASAEAVAADVLGWIDQQNADASVRQQAQELWNATALQEGNLDLLERTAATIALVEPRADSVLAMARSGAPPAAAVELEWLDDETTAPFVRDNLRLLFGRSLVQRLFYDEALQTLGGLKSNEVVDPAALLFSRAVAHHRLIHKNEGLEAVEKLLENEDTIPRRYAVLARLMRSDLSQIKDGSLDDISRRMQDVERRLGHGRANQRVRDVEDEVITMLDKLIEEEEKKQQQQSGGGGGAGGGSQSSRPAPDSMPLGGKGPGQVTKRNIGDSAGWGELPPKQREEAMQEIGRDFPAHYREVIEEYFREIAKER